MSCPAAASPRGNLGPRGQGSHVSPHGPCHEKRDSYEEKNLVLRVGLETNFKQREKKMKDEA